MATKAQIDGPAFDQLYPRPSIWRAAGRPDYGFREWQDRTAAERGLVMGDDYEAGMWEDYDTVKAWCYGVLDDTRTGEAIRQEPNGY